MFSVSYLDAQWGSGAAPPKPPVPPPADALDLGSNDLSGFIDSADFIFPEVISFLSFRLFGGVLSCGTTENLVCGIHKSINI